MTNKAIRCTERDKDGHRCSKKATHVDQRDNLKHSAFGKEW